MFEKDYHPSQIEFEFVRDDYSGQEGWAVSLQAGDLRGAVICSLLDTPSGVYYLYNDEETCEFCLDEEHFDAYMNTPALQNKSIYGVRHSGLNKRLRAEGLGQQMYLILLYELAKRGGVLVPNVAFGGSTSLAAQRAWWSLSSQPGVKVYAGKFFSGEGLTEDVYKTPQYAKRERGWKERVHQRYLDRKLVAAQVAGFSRTELKETLLRFAHSNF